MSRAQGARSQMAAVFESAYGVAPVSGFSKMPFTSTSLGAAQPLLSSELLGNGRDPLAPVRDVITVDGDVVVPIDAESFGFWLKAAFGSPVTTGTTNKIHTFKSGNWVIPSMAIEVAMPEIPRFAMYTGVVLDELSFSMQRSGLLTASAKLLCQAESLDTSTNGGTPANWVLQRFGHFNGSIKRAGSVLGNVVSADVTYKNNLDPIETIRSDGQIDGADPTNAELTGKIDVRFADNVLMNDAINGTPITLEFSYSISANVSLTITAHEVYLPIPKAEITGPAGIQVSFDYQAAFNSAAGQMCTVVLKNQIASY